MHWDLEPARANQSAAGPAHSKTWRKWRATVANALASWSAADLRRFRWERALEIRAVHGECPGGEAFPPGRDRPVEHRRFVQLFAGIESRRISFSKGAVPVNARLCPSAHDQERK